jgi:hypothetical protein
MSVIINILEKESAMRIYFDNCSYNRPFDDQSQIKIRLETSAKIYIQADAMNVLIENFGEVDAERFISIVKSDNFDYTKWQRNLWKDKTIDEIYNMAKEFEEKNIN